MERIVSDKIFEPDEMNLISVDPKWSSDDLLAMEGIFFLKDIAGILQLDPVDVSKHVKTLEASGINTWEEMGVRKIWNHWGVRMKVFAPYYRENLNPKYQRIPKDIDPNGLLNMEGVFLLSQVCNYIPFTTSQIRYQSKKNKNAKEECGVWKDLDLKRYLVDMRTFSKWMKEEWQC